MIENILIIDNYDSFTYNLYQYVGEISPNIEVYRNDKITLEKIEEMNPTHIIISPGPGFPKDAGICIEAIRKFGRYIPILGYALDIRQLEKLRRKGSACKRTYAWKSIGS